MAHFNSLLVTGDSRFLTPINGTVTTKSQGSDITIADGDKLLVSDYSDGDKIVRSSLAFDDSTTDQCLSKQGTWEDVINHITFHNQKDFSNPMIYISGVEAPNGNIMYSEGLKVSTVINHRGAFARMDLENPCRVFSVIGTQTSATATWTGYINSTELKTGDVILYYLPYDGVSSTPVTLNLTLSNNTTTGAKNCYVYANTRLTTHYASGRVITMTYYAAGTISVNGTATTDDRWECGAFRDTDTVPSAVCTTGATTAAKTASCSYYTATANSFTHIVVRYTNTSAHALTLNINSQGAKPIYINGKASSSSNYNLKAGTYLIYYDGTNYYFRTDGIMDASAKEGGSVSKYTSSLAFNIVRSNIIRVGPITYISFAITATGSVGASTKILKIDTDHTATISATQNLVAMASDNKVYPLLVIKENGESVLQTTAASALTNGVTYYVNGWYQ